MDNPYVMFMVLMTAALLLFFVVDLFFKSGKKKEATFDDLDRHAAGAPNMKFFDHN